MKNFNHLFVKAGLVLSLVSLFTISAVSSAYAFSLQKFGLFGDNRGQEKKEISESQNETNQTTVTPQERGLLKNLVGKGRGIIGNGTLTAINGTTLTVTKNGKTYTILTDAKTQFRRRFWGKALLSEFQIGDMINVVGRWTDNTHTTIQAVLVRDLSQQKRFGVFFGTVSSLNANGWVMQTRERGNETVTVSSSTKFINRSNNTITQADIKVGDKVRVKGLWDSKNHTITEVSVVKDFSLPPKPTPTPTP